MAAIVEHMLCDGGRVSIEGNSVRRRQPDGRVRDLSWWPLWKVADLLREQKIGGFDSRDEQALRTQESSGGIRRLRC